MPCLYPFRSQTLQDGDLLRAVALTVDSLVGLACGDEEPLPGLWLQRKHIHGGDLSTLRFTRFTDEGECVVDVSVYRSQLDPYIPLATAESEPVGDKTPSSGDGRCLWDLFKLLMWASPLRLFVLRAHPENLQALEQRIEDLVKCYAGYFLRRPHFFDGAPCSPTRRSRVVPLRRLDEKGDKLGVLGR